MSQTAALAGEMPHIAHAESRQWEKLTLTKNARLGWWSSLGGIFQVAPRRGRRRRKAISLSENRACLPEISRRPFFEG